MSRSNDFLMEESEIVENQKKWAKMASKMASEELKQP
jgi:hypothetical protein